MFNLCGLAEFRFRNRENKIFGIKISLELGHCPRTAMSVTKSDIARSVMAEDFLRIPIGTRELALLARIDAVIVRQQNGGGRIFEFRDAGGFAIAIIRIRLPVAALIPANEAVPGVCRHVDRFATDRDSLVRIVTV